MSAQWFQIYEARFGKPLTETEVAVWEDEIRRDISSLRHDEIMDAIRSLAEDDRKEGAKRRYAPDVEDIITRIIRSRYEAKEAQRVPSDKCGLCHDGWVSFGFRAEKDGPDMIRGVEGFVIKAGTPGSMNCSTYCRCARGSDHLSLAVKAERTTEVRAKALGNLVFKAIRGEL